MFANRNRGFTLIELLVVIAIIGILSSVVLASLNSARQKSRDARRVGDVKQLQLALEMYYDTEGDYPTTAEGLLGELVPTYIPAEPLDPQSGASYTYGSIVASSSYVLRATLESTTHKALGTDINGTVAADGGNVDCADASGYYCVRP